jgi:hypothetical protein
MLSNGWGWWLDALKRALQQDGCDDLKSSLDVGEQVYVAMAVDMAITEKAEVFVENGVSFLISSLFSLFSPSLPLPIISFVTSVVALSPQQIESC